MMKISGLQKLTLIDYPGRLAATVFLSGCNFRCPWCYSSELVLPEKIKKQPKISEKEFFDFLRERQGLLEAVTICGGEPSINKDLPQFIKKIKNLEYFVKLDTNGSNPKMLKNLIEKKLIDYVAMDIKLNQKSKSKEQNDNLKFKNYSYEDIMRKGVKFENIERSVRILKEGKVDYEFRTTAVPGIHEKKDFLEIAKWIGGANVKYYLQNFQPEKTIDPSFEKIKPYPKEFLENIAKEISLYFKVCQVR